MTTKQKLKVLRGNYLELWKRRTACLAINTNVRERRFPTAHKFMTTFFQRGFLLLLAHTFQPINGTAFWGVKLSGKAKQYYRFGSKCCLCLQGKKGQHHGSAS
jgi:hypothetical protein